MPSPSVEKYFGWVTPAANQSYREELAPSSAFACPDASPEANASLTVMDCRRGAGGDCATGTGCTPRIKSFAPKVRVSHAALTGRGAADLLLCWRSSSQRVVDWARGPRQGAACLATVIIVFVLTIGRDLSYTGPAASAGRPVAFSCRRPDRLHPVGGGDASAGLGRLKDWAA